MYLCRCISILPSPCTAFSSMKVNKAGTRIFNSAARKSELGVSSFGISVTTMEEVFIKVGEGSAETVEDRYDYNGRSHNWLGIHFLLVHGTCRYRCKTDVLESADTEPVRLGR